jgi:polyisoprenoid-binding protein YceI
VSNFLEKSWGKFFKLDFKTQRGISRALFFFVFAIGFLISDFMAAELGWLAFMLGFVSIMMHGKRSGALWNLFLAVSAFASVGAFMEIGNVSSVELSSGKVLAGVVLAGGIALLMNTLSRARKNKLWSNVISLGLAFLAPIILIIGGTQNVQFGGTDAFVGLLIGFALTTMFGINIKKNISVFGIYMVLGLVLIPLTSVDEAQTTLSTMTKVKGESSTEKMSSPMGLAGKAVDQNGSFNIIKENSKIVFELGPKNGRTKGAINALVGSFNIENNFPSMKVELDIASLTTFNDIRDESLMSDMYFNSVKFPKMTFTSKSAILSGDVYELQGEFEMLGMKKNQIVKMKYLGSKDGQMNFVGEGSLDRTEFGMTPDSKEGNIVDFMFEVSVK